MHGISDGRSTTGMLNRHSLMPTETPCVETCVRRSQVECGSAIYEIRVLVQIVPLSARQSPQPTPTDLPGRAVGFAADLEYVPTKRLFQSDVCTTI